MVAASGAQDARFVEGVVAVRCVEVADVASDDPEVAGISVAFELGGGRGGAGVEGRAERDVEEEWWGRFGVDGAAAHDIYYNRGMFFFFFSFLSSAFFGGGIDERGEFGGGYIIRTCPTAVLGVRFVRWGRNGRWVLLETLVSVTPWEQMHEYT